MKTFEEQARAIIVSWANRNGVKEIEAEELTPEFIAHIAAALLELREECAQVVRRHDDGDRGTLLSEIEQEIRRLGEK